MGEAEGAAVDHLQLGIPVSLDGEKRDLFSKQIIFLRLSGELSLPITTSTLWRIVLITGILQQKILAAKQGSTQSIPAT